MKISASAIAKQRLWLILLLAGSTLAIMPSCSDEDDDEPTTQSDNADDDKDNGSDSDADSDADGGDKDSTEIHPDSVRLVEGGFTAKAREEATNIINQLRKEGCECTMDGRTEFLQTDVMLEWDARLETATLRHSKDMAKNMILGHGGSDGSTFRIRMTDAGYPASAAGENVAFNYEGTKDVVHKGWKLSTAGHCNNMMDEKYDRFGLSMQRDIQGRPFWTLLVAESPLE